MVASSSNNWMVFHEGGGWCNGDSNCLRRAGTDLGSSLNYTLPLVSSEGDALFNEFPESTIVYAKYCDGGSWSGGNSSVTYVEGTPIYYRGRLLLDSLFDDLKTRGLATADELIYAGSGSGN